MHMESVLLNNFIQLYQFFLNDIFSAVVFAVVTCLVGYFLNSYYVNRYGVSGISWPPLILQIVFVVSAWAGHEFFKCDASRIALFIAGALVCFVVSLVHCLVRVNRHGATALDVLCALLAQILISIGSSVASVIIVFLILIALGGNKNDEDKKKNKKRKYEKAYHL